MVTDAELVAIDYPGRFIDTAEIDAEAQVCHTRCTSSWCDGPEDHGFEAVRNIRRRELDNPRPGPGGTA